MPVGALVLLAILGCGFLLARDDGLVYGRIHRSYLKGWASITATIRGVGGVETVP